MTDGLVPPFNAPGTQQPVPGIQPGAPTIFNRIIVGGPNGGIFYYASNLQVASNLPQKGNLAISEVNQNGLDPYGNAVLAGITNYTVGLSVADAEQFWAGQINWYTGPVSEAGPWTLTTTIDNGGPGLRIGGGVSGNGVQFRDPIQAPLVAIQPGTSATPETWHSLGTLAGFTVSVARYRYTIEAETELDFVLTGGGANAASVQFSNTMPLPYALGNGQGSSSWPLTTNKVIAAGDILPRVVVTSAGAVLIVSNANRTDPIWGGARIPTN